MVFGQWPKKHRLFKRLAKALIRLRVCAGWSEPLLVAHNTLLEIAAQIYKLQERSISSEPTPLAIIKTVRPTEIVYAWK